LNLEKKSLNKFYWGLLMCLKNQLYINLLNDLGNYTIADHDVLHLPIMTLAAGEPPKYHTLFNQLKQEYALEPEVQELPEICNHIERNHLRSYNTANWAGDDPDGYTYSIGRGKFERKTLKLMRLVHSAIIYTSLIIHHEEQQKPKQGPALPINLPDLPFRDKL